MIVQLGLLLATYIGSKVLASVREEQQNQRAAQGAGPEEQSLEVRPGDESSAIVAETAEVSDEQQLRHLQVSLLSLGLFAARFLIPAAMPLGMLAYLYGAVPYMRNVERSLVRDKRVNVDVLFFAADTLTLGVGSYFTAAFGLSMIHAGRHMVRKAKADSAKMVTHLFRELPDTVWVSVGGVEVEVPLSRVEVGDLVIIGAGGAIPVDGTIVEGTAQVDQSALTGESQPAEKGLGDSVFANTLVTAGRLVIRVGRSGADTTSAQIAAALLNSVSFKTGVQLKGEEWADAMTLPMLVTALVALPLTGPVSAAVLINAHIGARILVSAPVTTLNHIREASLAGVLVKDGRALEQLCTVDTILFDKTGTLTTGEPEVARVTSCGSCTPGEILSYAATAERRLTHPIARAILRKAEQEGREPFEAQDCDYTIGYGVSVVVSGRFVRVGSVRFLREAGLSIPDEVAALQRAARASGSTVVVVAIDDEIAGAIELCSQRRPEAIAMIAELRSLGIQRIGIVSGDDEAPTRRLAEELGLDEYFYNVLPDDKAQIVKRFRAEGHVVCFIGDGINDSIALKSANVAMSIAGASSIAKDMAEIVFMDGTLKRLVDVLELSQRLHTNLRRSLAISLVPSVANFMGAFVLRYDVLTALLVNNVFSTLGVTRLFYTQKRPDHWLQPPAEESALEAESLPQEPPASTRQEKPRLPTSDWTRVDVGVSA